MEQGTIDRHMVSIVTQSSGNNLRNLDRLCSSIAVDSAMETFMKLQVWP